LKREKNMSVREALVKFLSTILRSSKATQLVLLSDDSGLSIARIGRSTELNLDPNAITSVSAAAFSAAEENWNDLQIHDQIVAFSFFEKICLVTIRIGKTLLTIVHDYNIEWPLNADNIGSCMFHLKREISNFFEIDENLTEKEIEVFSNNVRSAIYLFAMGTEIPFATYSPDNANENEEIQNISKIMDSVQNPVLAIHSMVTPGGLTVDERNAGMVDIPISTEAFSANANVAFQKMIEEAGSLNIGSLLSYICISGESSDNFYGILVAPSGKLNFTDNYTKASSTQNMTFISLFPLTYGAIPVLGEARNIVYSMLEVLGDDPITQAFINSVSKLSASKYS
jgi:hypothetical protein